MRPAWRAGRSSSTYAALVRGAAGTVGPFGAAPPEEAVAALERYVRAAGIPFPVVPGGDARGVLDSVGFRQAVASQIYLLAGLGRLIPVATLLAVVLELGWGLAGGTGLMALQAGFPQRVAFGHALVSLAIGGVSAGTHFWLMRRTRAALHATERAVRGPGDRPVLAS